MRILNQKLVRNVPKDMLEQYATILILACCKMRYIFSRIQTTRLVHLINDEKSSEVHAAVGQIIIGHTQGQDSQHLFVLHGILLLKISTSSGSEGVQQGHCYVRATCERLFLQQ